MRCPTIPISMLLATLLPLVAGAAPGDERWSPAFDRPGLSGRIFALGSYQGRVVAGGFQTLAADGAYFDQLAILEDGTWRDVGGGVTGSVRAITEVGSDLVVAGEFLGAGGELVRSVARWDGTDWHPFGAGLELSWALEATVWDVVEYQGDLYAAGDFDESGGAPVLRIARWDGSAWQPVGGGITGSFEPKVLDLAVYDGRLIAVGEFDTAGGVPASNIAAWDGTSWSALGSGIGGNGISVFVAEPFGGELYVGGNFSTAGGSPARRIARWDGAAWHEVGGGLPDWDISVTVYSMAVRDDALYVGGNFIGSETVSSSRVIRWTGSAWEGVGGIHGTDLATTAIAMHVMPDGLWVGGEMKYVGFGPEVTDYTMSWGLTRFDGTTWHAASEGLGFWGGATELLEFQGEMIAVGGLLGAGEALALRAAAFDGTTWRPLADFDREIDCAVVFEDELWVSGPFSEIDGVDIQGTASFDGTTWTERFGGGGQVLTVHEGELYGAGLGQPRRWTGTGWETVGTPGTVFGQAYDMISYGGELLLGGSVAIAGVPERNLLAFDGTSWRPFEGGADDIVHDLELYQGDLVAGGWFSTIGGVSARSIARFDGAGFEQLHTGLGNNVTELFALGDHLYVGGSFNDLVGDPMDYIGYFDGSGWQPMGSGTNFSPSAFRHDPVAGVLYVAGGFFRAGGIPAYGLSTWDLDPVTVEVPGGAASPGVTVSAPAPNPFRAGTSLSFSLTRPGEVEATVHDVVGRRVARLAVGVRSAGEHELRWDGTTDAGREVPAGIYVVRLRTEEGITSRKVLRID